MTRILVVLSVAILVLDAIEASISRVSGVPYAWFSLVQVVVYIALGFFLRRTEATLGQLAALVGVTAAVEATFGQLIATAMSVEHLSRGEMIVAVPLAVFFQTILGLIGFALGAIGKRASA
jgi:hypothetical protein